MTALSIQPPFPTFSEADGSPLEDGYIWIGTANLNPITNPIAVFWDAALTLPAAQPIRTQGGYPANNGTPARLYVNSDYSIQVQNRNGSVVYSAAAATERYGNLITFADITGTLGLDRTTGQLGSDRVNFLQAGTGAVTRTAQAKMRDVVSVLDFGAVGDGVTDDTAAINAAIVAAYQTGIGDVFLCENSTYLIDANADPIVDVRSGSRNGGVKLKSNITLHLNGATLKCKTSPQLGYSVVNFSGTDNAALVGPGFIQGDLLTHTATGGEWGYGIYAVNCTNFKIKDVDIRSCWGDGLYIGTSNPALIATRAIGGDISGLVSRRNRRQGCSISSGSNINFVSCVFKETGVDGVVAPGSGVDIEADGVPEYSENINFTNCTFSQNLGFGLILSGYAGSVKSATVTSCQIVGNVQAGVGASSAVSAKFVATKIEGGFSGGVNCSLFSCDVENSTGTTYTQAITLFPNANFEMVGGSVKSIGTGYTLLYTDTNPSRRTKNMFNGVKFILTNGPSGTVCNVNGLNLFESCMFFAEGTIPAGAFGFDISKFNSGETDILNCWFDPTWHTNQSGDQFKGNVTQKSVRGAYAQAPNYGTWSRGDIVYNPEPTELGAVSSKYVITGWICTVGGSPGTWLQMRTLTGN